MTLLQERDAKRAARNETDRAGTLAALRSCLRELVPGERVVIFGSITRAGRFRTDSDVDIALYGEPSAISQFQLQCLLEERLHRPVDVVVLPQCRFRETILREGEEWTT